MLLGEKKIHLYMVKSTFHLVPFNVMLQVASLFAERYDKLVVVIVCDPLDHLFGEFG